MQRGDRPPDRRPAGKAEGACPVPQDTGGCAFGIPTGAAGRGRTAGGYAETSAKYNVSYQQARNYTVKYEAGGIEALRDRRGRTKPLDEMSELEKLRAENRILRAEKERAEMEASFLKKLDEIERRRG